MVCMIANRKYSQVKCAFAGGLLKNIFFFFCSGKMYILSEAVAYNLMNCYFIFSQSACCSQAEKLAYCLLFQLVYWLIFLFNEKLKCQIE